MQLEWPFTHCRRFFFLKVDTKVLYAGVQDDDPRRLMALWTVLTDTVRRGGPTAALVRPTLTFSTISDVEAEGLSSTTRRSPRRSRRLRSVGQPLMSYRAAVVARRELAAW